MYRIDSVRLHQLLLNYAMWCQPVTLSLHCTQPLNAYKSVTVLYRSTLNIYIIHVYCTGA